MQPLGILLKMDLKRLLRQPVLCLVILMLPMVCAACLNLTSVSEPQAKEALHNVLLYYMDDSESELSQSIYEQLAQNPDYRVTYSGLHHMGLKAAQEKIEHEIRAYSLGVYLYVPEDVEERLENEEQAFYLFDGGYDDRVGMLMQKLTIYAMQYQSGTLSRQSMQEEASVHLKPEKTLYIDEQDQVHHKVENGYSFSIHMFIGLIVVIFVWTQFQLFAMWRTQKEEGISERIALSGMSPWISVLERGLVLMVLLVVQCLSVLVGISCLVQVDLKIAVGQIIVSIAMLGVAFGCFSYLIETLFRQNPIGVYMALFSLLMGNMLSGIYFPFDVRANWQEQVACFLPQHQLIRCWSGLAQSKEGVFLFYAVWVGAYCFFVLALARWIKGIQNTSVLEGLSGERRNFHDV